MKRIALMFAILASIAVGYPSSLSSEKSQYGTYCGLSLQAENRNRHVYGQVTAECNSCAWWNHTGPFGNWGVASWFGSPQDGEQYQGWTTYDLVCDRVENTPEWNSCTTENPPPDYRTYNEPPGVFTSQLSTAIGSMGVAFDWFQTSEEEGCSILDGATYTSGTFMSIYELDRPDGDEHVTDTAFDTVVTLSCQRDGCAPVSSPWVANWGNAVTSAEFRFRVIGSCLNVDGKGGC